MRAFEIKQRPCTSASSVSPARNSMLTRARHHCEVIQKKSTTDLSDEPLECEANNVAATVLAMRDPARAESNPVVIRHKCAEEKRTVQAKLASEGDPRAALNTEAAMRAAEDNGAPLPPPVRSYFEARFGYDFSRVRVHADRTAAESARGIQARAYTVGRDVVFGEGCYAPDTAGGKSLLAHELAHVVQQDGGRISPVIQRQEAGGDIGGTPQGGNKKGDCSGWERDPQSFCIQLANHYVRTQDHKQPAMAKSVSCPSADQCTVAYDDGIKISISLKDRPDHVSAMQIDRSGLLGSTCIYEYDCTPSGSLVFKERSCSI